ncbi:PREDICTED: CD276 antigen-like [Thamnophis sirtalis]|uniref:CD276 antigen-like n=1 Tax=Thamnophis sirtalis TaxID=35019 RepID=A0A6I9YS43_9SAUR|nr:PREDICTED: CD276 antigen-like [Thamnophis sirtalis]
MSGQFYPEYGEVLSVVLSSSPSGAVEIKVSEDPVVALVGHDAILHCSFSPEANFSLNELSLFWQVTDTNQMVHGFTEGRDQPAYQGSTYANRTALFYDQLAHGNMSLLLRRVQISDEGSFTCFVKVRDFSRAAVSLQMAARSFPRVIPVQGVGNHSVPPTTPFSLLCLLPGQHLLFPAVALWVTVGLSICLVVLLMVLAYVCQKKIRQSCKEEKAKAALQPLKNMDVKEEMAEEID